MKAGREGLVWPLQTCSWFVCARACCATPASSAILPNARVVYCLHPLVVRRPGRLVRSMERKQKLRDRPGGVDGVASHFSVGRPGSSERRRALRVERRVLGFRAAAVGRLSIVVSPFASISFANRASVPRGSRPAARSRCLRVLARFVQARRGAMGFHQLFCLTLAIASGHLGKGVRRVCRIARLHHIVCKHKTAPRRQRARACAALCLRLS